MSCRFVGLTMLWLFILPLGAFATPMNINGDPFVHVATGPGTAQLFGLTSDAQGRIYIGHNSNNTSGIPLQLFDPNLYLGSPIALQNFGVAVGDADGLTFGGGIIYSPDRDEGMRQTNVGSLATSILVPGATINPTGSPIVYRPSDGHLFIGFGASAGVSAPGDNRIDEYTATGTLVQSFSTISETETMTIDPATGLIYYADFDFFGPSEIHAFNPITATDTFIGFSTGTVDGALAYDPLSGLLFLGTANGLNPGYVETMHPDTGLVTLFATGFNGSLGILREPTSGDLYFLEANRLYRLDSSQVFPEPVSTVPEPASLTIFLGLSMLGLSIHGGRWMRQRSASA